MDQAAPEPEAHPSAPTHRPRRRPFEAVLLVLAAAGMVWHTGHRGFMPLDHAVTFDGGWRVLSGQVPLLDFAAPSFLTPSVLQAVVFALGGVTWSAFVAHAALANALFALATWDLVRRLGSATVARGEAATPATAGALELRVLAFGAGLLSAVLFYPPVGVPFADQHAFGFTLAAVWSAVVARGHGRRVGPEAGAGARCLALWAATPLLVLAGFLSKQLPSSLAPLLVLLVLAAPGPRPRREAVRGILLGVGLTLLLIGAALAGLASGGVTPAEVREVLFDLPMAEAEQRRAYMPSGAGLVVRVLGAGGVVGGLHLAWLHLGLAIGVGVALLRFPGRAAETGARASAGLALALGLALLLLGQVTMVLANNQDAAAAAFVVPGLALVLVAARALSGLARAVLTGAAVLLLLAEPLHWAGDLLERRTNDMVFDAATAPVVGADSSPVLAGLAWQTPPVPPNRRGRLGLDEGAAAELLPLDDLLGMAELLAVRDGDFLLVGDAAVLYAMTGRRSVLPSLWYHPGVTIPPAGTDAFRAWQESLVAQVRDGRIARIVEERAGTWIRGWRLEDLPRVQRAARERGFTVERHGVFRLLELAPVAPGEPGP